MPTMRNSISIISQRSKVTRNSMLHVRESLAHTDTHTTDNSIALHCIEIKTEPIALNKINNVYYRSGSVHSVIAHTERKNRQVDKLKTAEMQSHRIPLKLMYTSKTGNSRQKSARSRT